MDMSPRAAGLPSRRRGFYVVVFCCNPQCLGLPEFVDRLIPTRTALVADAQESRMAWN